MELTDAKLIELVEAIDRLRSAGWTVEPPASKRSVTARRASKNPVGRPPKNGRRKRGRPPKTKELAVGIISDIRDAPVDREMSNQGSTD
jgi:hypothetical protein